MLRNKPMLKYAGITIVLSNPSRFDTCHLLSAKGGVLIHEALQPEYNEMQCDIRLADDPEPFLSGTKAIILCGQKAMHKYDPTTRNNTINELRGSPLYIGTTPAIAIFSPQEAMDYKASHEKEFNKQASQIFEEEGDDEESGDVKRIVSTKPSNYGFWIRKDIGKIKRLLKEGTGTWNKEVSPTYKLFPDANEVIEVLESDEGEFLDFDMETDYEEQNLLCFAFSVDNGKTIYSVPILDYRYELAYGNTTYSILRALAVGIKKRTLVAHNGSGFDFIVLTRKYHIPVYKLFDTMVSHHRIYPDVEKSLGHFTSLWTNQRFHKDTDSWGYRTKEHLMSKLLYCAKDVYTMSLGRQAMIKFAKTIPGLSASIELANRSLLPYLVTTLQGIKYDEGKMKEVIRENDLLMEQYLRIIRMLMGPVAIEECKKALKGKPSKAKAFPSSNKQCCDYFHRQLDYPVVFRTDTGAPSLGKTIMYKLQMRHNNPVTMFVNMYRAAQHETGMLKFIPWCTDDRKPIDPREWLERTLLK